MGDLGSFGGVLGETLGQFGGNVEWFCHGDGLVEEGVVWTGVEVIRMGYGYYLLLWVGSRPACCDVTNANSAAAFDLARGPGERSN